MSKQHLQKEFGMKATINDVMLTYCIQCSIFFFCFRYCTRLVLGNTHTLKKFVII